MVDPKQTAGYKFERRNGSYDEGSRLGQRLKNRFSMCFTSPSPPPPPLSQLNFTQRKPKSRSRTPMRDSEFSPEDDASFGTRLRDERVDVDTIECTPMNFRAVLHEYYQLKRRHDQLNLEYSVMERNASEIATTCCTVINENNRKLRQTLESTILLDHMVQDLRSQLDIKDSLIKDLQQQQQQSGKLQVTKGRQQQSSGSTSTIVR